MDPQGAAGVGSVSQFGGPGAQGCMLAHALSGTAAPTGLAAGSDNVYRLLSGTTTAGAPLNGNVAVSVPESRAAPSLRSAALADDVEKEGPDGAMTYGPSGTIYKAKKRRKYRHESFPEKLYRMLIEVEQAGDDDVVSFTLQGVGFEVHQPEVFAEKIIPKFFRHKRMASFRRQLSMYGFQRVSKGQDQGSYVHELFVKGRPDLCRKMKRVTELEVIAPGK